MKLIETNLKTESAGIMAESFFNIDKDNIPFIMGILRNNLYSNKPLALIREYSCNALDAHKDAGIPDRPFTVQLPTRLANDLTIRDYGKGLSEDGVLNVFSSYGMSTKRDTNEQIGGFGIGCKSAFSYTNTFRITSYFEGVKSIYEAYIDETNLGKISKLYSEPSKEESGLEIKINIQPKDIQLFHDCAKEFFVNFDVIPDINEDVKNHIITSKEILEKSTLVSFENWKFLGSRSNYTCFKVIVGSVCYPVNLNLLGNNKEIQDIERSISSSTILINLPIGSVQVSASREALEYNTQTIEVLTDSLIKAYGQLNTKLLEKVNSLETLWQKRFFIYRTRKHVNKFLTTGDNYGCVDHYMNHPYSGFTRKFGGQLRIKYSYASNFNDANGLATDNEPTLLINDKSFSQATVVRRANAWIRDNPNERYYYICTIDQPIDEFLSHEEIVGCKYVNLAEIVPTGISKRTYSLQVAADEIKVYKGCSYSDRKSEKWITDTMKTDSDPNSFVYVTTINKATLGENKYDEYLMLYSWLKLELKDAPTLIAVQSENVQPNWVSFEAWMLVRINQLMNANINFKADLYRHYLKINMSIENFTVLQTLDILGEYENISKLLKEPSPGFPPVYKRSSPMYLIHDYNTSRIIHKHIPFDTLDKQLSEQVTKLNKVMNDTINKYPILRLINSTNLKTSQQSIDFLKQHIKL